MGSSKYEVASLMGIVEVLLCWNWNLSTAGFLVMPLLLVIMPLLSTARVYFIHGSHSSGQRCFWTSAVLPFNPLLLMSLLLPSAAGCDWFMVLIRGEMAEFAVDRVEQPLFVMNSCCSKWTAAVRNEQLLLLVVMAPLLLCAACSFEPVITGRWTRSFAVGATAVMRKPAKKKTNVNDEQKNAHPHAHNEATNLLS